MYEKAMDLLLSRDADIQSDKRVLNILVSNDISIPETWNQLMHLKNGSIRFNACQEFLKHQIGPGSLEQSGDIRNVYSAKVSSGSVSITLPGIQAPEQCIFVSLSAIYRIVDKPKSSLPISSRENFLEEYLNLLQEPNNIPDRVRIRSSSEMQEWSDLMCWLYYVFVLHPKDWIKGRCSKEYWMRELEEEKSLRISKEVSAKNCWENQRLAADTFKKCIYPQLLPFEMPILFQISHKKISMPIKDFFALTGR